MPKRKGFVVREFGNGILLKRLEDGSSVYLTKRELDKMLGTVLKVKKLKRVM